MKNIHIQPQQNKSEGLKKLCVVKLGALGDVVRTLSVLPAIKEKFPDSEITWITQPNAESVVEQSPFVDKVITNLSAVPKEHFDVLYNFDIEKDATNLAERISSEKKLGFRQEGGYAAAYNLPAEDYLNTLFDDETKKSNRRTYQELMFKAAELPWKKQHHVIHIPKTEKKYAQDFLEENKINKDKLIGVHLGASSRWPSKKWHRENLKDFIKSAKQKNYEIILFGGPNEILEHEEIFNELKEEGFKIYRNKSKNSFLEFASLVDLCSHIVCVDSLALHVALALRKPTVGLFFVTSHHEVEDYDMLIKLASPRLSDFFPEKMDVYDEELTKSISADAVLDALENKFSKVANAIIMHPKEQEKNKFLIIKRPDGLHKGKWAFPGGKVNSNETFEEALTREVKEEVGLEVLEIVCAISEYNYPREDESKTFGKSFFVKTDGFDVVCNHEVGDFKWVSLEEMEGLECVPGVKDEMLQVLGRLTSGEVKEMKELDRIWKDVDEGKGITLTKEEFFKKYLCKTV